MNCKIEYWASHWNKVSASSQINCIWMFSWCMLSLFETKMFSRLLTWNLRSCFPHSWWWFWSIKSTAPAKEHSKLGQYIGTHKQYNYPRLHFDWEKPALNNFHFVYVDCSVLTVNVNRSTNICCSKTVETRSFQRRVPFAETIHTLYLFSPLPLSFLCPSAPPTGISSLSCLPSHPQGLLAIRWDTFNYSEQSIQQAI